MQLLMILAVVAVFAISERAPQVPVENAGRSVAIALAVTALVTLLAALIAARTVRRIRTRPTEYRRALSDFARWRSMHAAVWLASAAAVVYGVGWTQLVRCNWRLDGVPLVGELLILLPLVLPMTLSWAAFYRVETALAADPARGAKWLVESAKYAGFNLRHHLGLLLAPLLFLLAVEDVVHWALPWLAEQNKRAILYVPLLVAMAAVFPAMLGRIWRTEPLPPGPLRDRLVALCHRSGARFRDIRIWHSNSRIVNAAVAGFLPRWRYLFLTDGLLKRLDDEEIQAVVAHEIGHVRHGHLWLRVLAVVAPALLLMVADRVFPQLPQVFDGQLIVFGLPGAVQQAVLYMSAVVLYAVMVFGPYCRRLEHQADLFACRAELGIVAGPPETQRTTSGCAAERHVRYIAALEKLSALAGGARRHSTWLHPSTLRRVALLEAVHTQPARAVRIECRLRQVACFWVVASLMGLAVLLTGV